MGTINENIKPMLIMTLPPLLGSGAFIAGKFSVAEISPISLTFLRFLLAAVIIVPLMFRFETKDWRLRKDDRGLMLLVGVLGIPIYHVLFFLSLKHTSAINAGLITATMPMITSFFASLMLKETIGCKRMGAIALAFFGVALTVTNGSLETIQHMTFNFGDLMMLAAVVCFAMYGVLSKKIMPHYSPLIILSYGFVLGVVSLIPFVISDGLMEQLPRLSGLAWIAIVYMAVVASCLAYFIQQVAFKRYGASKTMLFYNFVPVFCIILASIFLGEQVKVLHGVSAAIIMSGVYINSNVI